MLTRQKLGHIAPIVAEAKMFSLIFQTPVADTAVSSSEEKGDATSTCQPVIKLSVEKKGRTGENFFAHRAAQNRCKPVPRTKLELQGFTEARVKEKGFETRPTTHQFVRGLHTMWRLFAEGFPCQAQHPPTNCADRTSVPEIHEYGSQERRTSPKGLWC